MSACAVGLNPVSANVIRASDVTRNSRRRQLLLTHWRARRLGLWCRLALRALAQLLSEPLGMTKAIEDSSDRRQYPRVRPGLPWPGEVLATQAPFVLRDTSLGGFCVEAPLAFEAGAEHRFTFTLPDRRHVALRGTVVHCLRLNVPGADPVYLVGFAVSRDYEADHQAIATLLDSMRSAERLSHVGQASNETSWGHDVVFRSVPAAHTLVRGGGWTRLRRHSADSTLPPAPVRVSAPSSTMTNASNGDECSVSPYPTSNAKSVKLPPADFASTPRAMHPGAWTC